MRKSITILILLSFANWSIAQTISYESIKHAVINIGEVHNGNENFEDFSNLKLLLENVEIVMLGEQSHGEGTAYDTKIKLIKYLHQELGFDMLAFESGIFDCDKAWQMIEAGGDAREAMGKSIFHIWATTNELEPLADYLEKEKDSDSPLQLIGFDSQLSGKYSKHHFIDDLSKYLNNINSSTISTQKWKHFSESMALITSYSGGGYKAFKKKEPKQDLAFILELIATIKKAEANDDREFWLQILKSTHAFLSDIALKTDFRDEQMADNLIWLKNKYPGRKIICWGATSHFLYNSTTVRMDSPFIQLLGGNYLKKHTRMGHFIKEKYQDKVYTIGFTAYQGEFGLNRTKKIKPPKENTLEYLLGQSEYDNFMLALNDFDLSGFKSRPLGNFYMKTDINTVMDAVIFNRDMSRPKFDANFFLSIYPENKYIKPVVVE